MLARFFSSRALLADRFLYATPESLGLAAREVSFAARRGQLLRGWYLAGERRGTVVFCPGNSANASAHLEYVRLARETGYSVLAFDYRGFGRSDGVPDLRGLVPDIRAAIEKVRAIAGAGEPVALFGISIGACAALAAAAPPSGAAASAVAGVAAEGLSDIYLLLRGIFREGRLGPYHIRSVESPGGGIPDRRRLRVAGHNKPTALAAALAWFACAFFPFEAKRPGRFAERLRRVPVLLVHGLEDAILPFEGTLEVHRLLAGPRRLWLIPAAGHAQEPAVSHRTEYVYQLGRFFAEAFGGGVPRALPLGVETGREVRGEVEFSVAVRNGVAAPGASGARARRVLVTVCGEGKLCQGLVWGGEAFSSRLPAPVQLASALEVESLGDDGFPVRERDPLSVRYREGGYREAFRRMVHGINHMNLEEVDAALGDYVSLERAYPFDILAATYALRTAQATRGEVPGWPIPSEEIGRRSLERFIEIWRAHPFLPGDRIADSPLTWAKRVLAGGR